MSRSNHRVRASSVFASAYTSWALIVGLAVTTAAGCRDPGARDAATGETGHAALALTASTPVGLYRLHGTFVVTGAATTTASTSDNPEASSIGLDLAPGAYFAELANGWSLERQGADGTVAVVPALLTSQNPLPFEVRAHEITNARFSFKVDTAVVELGPGRVQIGVDVDDSPVAGPRRCSCRTTPGPERHRRTPTS